jgi:hypothetical protein
VIDPKARNRAAALAALARLRAPDLARYLPAALYDSSTLVVKQALRIYRAGREGLCADTLRAAYANAPNAAVRAALVRAWPLLDKWQGLELLLTGAADTPPTAARGLIVQLGTWHRQAASRFTPFPDAMREPLREVYARARAAQPDWRWAGIEGLVRTL